VTTRVLTKVVWESELVSAVEEGLLVTTAAWVEVKDKDVDVEDGVDDGVVDEGVEEVDVDEVEED